MTPDFRPGLRLPRKIPVYRRSEGGPRGPRASFREFITFRNITNTTETHIEEGSGSVSVTFCDESSYPIGKLTLSRVGHNPGTGEQEWRITLQNPDNPEGQVLHDNIGVRTPDILDEFAESPLQTANDLLQDF